MMFSPDHEASARELARVTRPGGRIALANWTPTGGLARMFKVMAPFMPAPPPSNPFDWGDPEQARELLGEWFDLELSEHVSTLRLPSGEAYWDLFSTSYGPTKVLADSLGSRREELHHAWVDFFETEYRLNGEIAAHARVPARSGRAPVTIAHGGNDMARKRVGTPPHTPKPARPRGSHAMAMAARINPVLALTVTLLALAAGVALAAPADLDPGFGSGGRLTLDESDQVRTVALQPDGKILVGGDVPTGGMPGHEGVVYRLNPSGSLDPTFASTGATRLTLDPGAAALGLQPDGKILAAGQSQGNAVVYRLTAQGLPDGTFDEDGVVTIDSGGDEDVHALALQPDGKILVAGETDAGGADGDDPVVYRLSPDGTPDGGFGSGGTSRIESSADEQTFALALQPDGRIVVAGFARVDGDADAVVRRLRANGTLDDSFGRNGTFEIDGGGTDHAYALVQQPDGRLLVVGASGGPNTTADTFVYRLRVDGTPDPTFGEAGRVGIYDGAFTAGTAAALQRDGKLLVTGATVEDRDYDAVVYRLHPDGSRDGGFGADGARRFEGHPSRSRRRSPSSRTAR